MKFIKYHWGNSKWFIIFSITTCIIFLGVEDSHIWNWCILFLNMFNLVGDYISFRKKKKNNII